MTPLPPFIILEPILRTWLLEDIGRGDRTTQGLLLQESDKGQAQWLAKEAGIVAGLPVAARIFCLLSEKVNFIPLVKEGEIVAKETIIAQIEGPLEALLMGERVALNITMRLSGIATLTQRYVKAIADLPTRLVDTRKTTPGLRLLEKYAAQVGGAINHRFGLDDAVMVKDNHIQAAGGITEAIRRICQTMPYPLTIEVETTTLEEVSEALQEKADIIMLDNMNIALMQQAVKLIRDRSSTLKIEASGNITLETIRSVAQTGVDYISSSAPITRSTWLDLSMRVK